MIRTLATAPSTASRAGRQFARVRTPLARVSLRAPHGCSCHRDACGCHALGLRHVSSQHDKGAMMMRLILGSWLLSR
jgi:hypothetical protein